MITKMALPILEDKTIKQVLRVILEGWVIQSKNDALRLDDAMIAACGGNKNQGYLLSLFSEWGNDIEAMANHFGLGTARKQPDGSLLFYDGTIDNLIKGGELVIVDIPPPPAPNWWWYRGQWNEPEVEPLDEQPE